MLDQIALLAAVTVLGVLEQAYFALQVIYARRKYKVSPPDTAGPPEFERVFRAHRRTAPNTFQSLCLSYGWLESSSNKVWLQSVGYSTCMLDTSTSRDIRSLLMEVIGAYVLQRQSSVDFDWFVHGWAFGSLPVTQFFCVENGNSKQTATALPVVNRACDC
ncbi:unnamed protein product [Lepidochelys kempii]